MEGGDNMAVVENAASPLIKARNMYVARFVNTLISDSNNPTFTKSQRKNVLSAADALQKSFNITEEDKKSQIDQRLIADLLFRPEEILETAKILAAKYNDEGERAFNLHDYGEAIEHFTKSLRAYPDIEIVLKRATSYIRVDKIQDAICDCEQALEMDPNSSKAHDLLGSIYFFTKQYENALSEHQIAVQLDPNNVQIQCHLRLTNTVCGGRISTRITKRSERRRIYQPVRHSRRREHLIFIANGE